MFAKTKNVRLRGKALKELNAAIHQRDNNRCVVCNCWVDPERKYHHEPCGTKKSDEITKGVVLCQCCHFIRHNGKNSADIKKKIRKYLDNLYGDQ